MATKRDSEELARLRSKVSYWNDKSDVEIPEGSDLAELFHTNIVAEFQIEDENDPRHGETVRVPVYRTGSLAKLFGKGTQTVRIMERAGVLPDGGVRTVVGQDRGRPKRGYTYDQFRLMYDLLPLLNFSDRRGQEYSPFTRELWVRMAKMPSQVLAKRGSEVAREKPRGRRRRGGD